jgi:hypothetical protein
MRPICRPPRTHIKKADGSYSARRAALGGRTLKSGQARWFIGYKKHTLRLWLSHHRASVLLVPLMTWAVPANRGDALFLWPSLHDSQRRLGWLPQWVVADMAYINLATQRRLREELGVAVVTRLRPDMHLVEPFSGRGTPRCHQGQPLRWLHYDAADQQQWFGALPSPELCPWCWEQARCPREFAYPCARHEILLGQVPYGSWLAEHLTKRVRPWIEPAQAYEKHQLGLSDFFLNSLQLTWVMCLLADTVVLLRAQAMLNAPEPVLPLGALTPPQLTFPW